MYNYTFQLMSIKYCRTEYKGKKTHKASSGMPLTKNSGAGYKPEKGGHIQGNS